jgi:curli biogenesis system outer membrane secretion channel CsgG
MTSLIPPALVRALFRTLVPAAALSATLAPTPALAQSLSTVSQPGLATWRGPRPRVGVLDLSGSALQMQSATTPTTGITSTTINLPAPTDFGRGLTQMLTTALVDQDQFVVLERAQLDKVVAEQDLAASGRVNPETAVALGKTIGAQVLISGDITEFSYQQSSVGSQLSIIKDISKQIGGKVDRLTAQVALDLRIIDAATGEVVGSVRGEGKASATGVSAELIAADKELGAGGSVQTPLGKASRQAIERAVAGLVAGMQKVPWSGRIVELRGGQVYINAGAKLGIHEGMQFDVFAQAQSLVDPETGLALGSPDARSGRISVTRVTEKYAIARVLEGKGFKRNDLVRYQGAAEAP